MKKFIYFIAVYMFCSVITTACTSNKIEDEKKLDNSAELIEEIDTRKEKADEEKTPVELDGEYFVIDRETFTDLFNSAENFENIEEWNKDDTDDEELEIYYTIVSDTVVELLKEKESEKYLGILVNSYCDTIEDLDKISQIPIIICSLCEYPFPITDSFLNDTTSAVYDTFNTGEKQYVYGKKGVFCYFYNNGVMSFFAIPPMKEEQTYKENEKEIQTVTNEEPQNNALEQDPQEQKIIRATKKVFGEENYINVFYEPEDNFVLIKAKGKDLLSSDMSAKGMLKSIKDTLYEIREIPDLNVDFNIVYTMVNSAGDTSDDIVIKATYKNETRNSINWDEYVLHEDMPKIADEWWVHPAIQAALEE